MFGYIVNRSKLDEIMQLSTSLLAPQGFECIEAEWAQHERILRLFVDRVEGAPAADEKTGINLDDCVVATRLLNERQELDEAVNGVYTLEVSSPGVERPLRLSRHFSRFVGKKASVTLKSKDVEHNRWTAEGTISGVDGDADRALVTLDTSEGAWSFPIANLKKAALVFDWGG